MRHLVIAVLLLSSACTVQKKQQKPVVTESPLPAFQKSFIPPALGVGNFEICLSDEAEASGLNDVTLPPGIIFASFGQMTGSLRGALNYDIQSVARAPNFEGTKYAVSNTAAIRLTSKAPCVITNVKAVLSEDFKFNHRAVQVALHLNFQAGGLYENEAGQISNDLKEPLLSATEGGFVFGAPIADINKFKALRSR